VKERLHTKTQGQRVHYLANLGGLVVLSGLEHTEPDMLLGSFLTVADELPRLSREKRTALRARGQARLTERGAEKRAWHAWQRSQTLHPVVLTSTQLHRLIRALGATVSPDADGVATLLALLEETDGVA
jgi:hypothetical protein